MGSGDSVTKQEFASLKPGDVVENKSHTIMLLIVKTETPFTPPILARYILHTTNDRMVGKNTWLGTPSKWAMVTA
jgi:hypothetical protein